MKKVVKKKVVKNGRVKEVAINVSDFRKVVRASVRAVEDGKKTFVLTHYGRPVAKVVPL